MATGKDDCGCEVSGEEVVDAGGTTFEETDTENNSCEDVPGPDGDATGDDDSDSDNSSEE